MPRFVLLRHECPPNYGKPSHWDLMLERAGVLMTWSLEELPIAWQQAIGQEPAGRPAATLVARKLPDHRLAYLEYEGPLSAGRGHVTRCAAGEYCVMQASRERWCIDLTSDTLVGAVVLSQDDGAIWRLAVDAQPQRSGE
ncbi:MAG: hypothetical protein IT424_05040 [Pirellulales bacterium]|nr:hypothetical protein [Pirellulales bacterium]